MAELEEGLIWREKLGNLEPVAEGVVQFHGFANVGIVYGRGETLLVDTGSPMLGELVVKGVRETSTEPIVLIVYTHGHVDHVGGTPALLQSAEALGHPRPVVWSQAGVAERFQRYERTWAWNNEVNRRQFQLRKGVDAFPIDFVYPDRTFDDRADLMLAGERVELHGARAETEDATWVWLPEREVALVGDLSLQSMPNTGNPNKTQRNTLGWAESLEAIAAVKPQHLIPGHGDPLHGDLALEVLLETARALRFLHDAVLQRMNDGLWPDEIVDAQIELPPDLAEKSYLKPIYGHSQFVVRDVLRRYAGWWGGDPSQLLPAPRREVARDFIETAGREKLIARIDELRRNDQLRRALHLAMPLVQADPDDAEAQIRVAEICEALAASEPSYIARNFYKTAAQQARTRTP